MESIFVRSLALTAAPDATCVTNASRSPTDGTFAVASCSDGVIQVYAASCAALLHEFATIHPRVHSLHYTSFSDSLVTLESDRPRAAGFDEIPQDADEETFLCVYHDWREKNMVRGYTLPLGVLDMPSSRRKADCVAVCSYTGRVVVAMGSVLNIWQCSQGFFEHVMELKVDMTQQDAYHVLEFVAIHGVYVAFGSSTEVRVMEVHVSSANDTMGLKASALLPQPRAALCVADADVAASSKASVAPEDDSSCVHFDSHGDLSVFESIPIPLASYGEVADESDYLNLLEKPTDSSTDQDESPVVLDRDEALQEELSLAGLIKQQDVRVNHQLNYYVAEHDIRIILRRYLPPNQRIQTLKFLPETIDNHASLEARSYARLLVGTTDHAFLYYFLSSEADATRKKMTKKVLHKTTVTTTNPSLVSPADTSFSDQESTMANDTSASSGRVVMHYAFAGPVSCITANSSFLFVTSASSLQVWSIWSPCHQLAATRAMRAATSHREEPTQPRLISVQPLAHPVAEIAALDAYVVLLPRKPYDLACEPRDFIRTTSAAAVELLPASELEMGLRVHTDRPIHSTTSMVIFQQSPPSAIYALVQSKRDLRSQTRVDLLLSLYSLYRYRADVGANALTAAAAAAKDRAPTIDARARMLMELETNLYNRLACDCAETLAAAFMDREMRDFSRAVVFFEASKRSPSSVLRAFEELANKTETIQDQIVQATHQYLEACVFDTARVSSRLLTKSPSATSRSDPAFTRSVVRHYMEHAPEQLHRLVTDSSLEWTLEDLHCAFKALQSVQVQDRDTARVTIARLVLILRAQSLAPAQWDASLQNQPSVHSEMRASCSREALASTVDNMISKNTNALTRLCVSHPGLLVCRDGTAPSALSQMLLVRSPVALTTMLESVFESAISRRESVVTSIKLCLAAIGDRSIHASITRITTRNSSGTTTSSNSSRLHAAESMTVSHGILLRLLCFVLDSFPRLHALAERDEISEDDDELLATRRLLAMELLHVCVELVTAAQTKTLTPHIRTELVKLFPANASSASRLADWEVEYLETRCLCNDEKETDPLETVICDLLQRAVVLLHEPKLLKPQEILTIYESAPANAFGFLLVLLALPLKRRAVDGLRLLSTRSTGVQLLLPYAKSYCHTLEEWKFLIETLSRMSEENDETQSASSSPHDELGVLESVLTHICSTLGPEDLLQVLPDDGDLALFMATIEASVRVEDARAAPSAHDLDGLAVH